MSCPCWVQETHKTCLTSCSHSSLVIKTQSFLWWPEFHLSISILLHQVGMKVSGNLDIYCFRLIKVISGAMGLSRLSKKDANLPSSFSSPYTSSGQLVKHFKTILFQDRFLNYTINIMWRPIHTNASLKPFVPIEEMWQQPKTHSCG